LGRHFTRIGSGCLYGSRLPCPAAIPDGDPVVCAALPPLAQTIERIKPSVVGVGTFLKTRSPSIQFVGTGFVVADGRYVITNAHTFATPLDTEGKEAPIVLVSTDGEPQPRDAELLAIDREHDLALLKIGGDPLPAMKLGDSASVREGQMLAFTGFPIGMVLGFHPATHRGMVAAITPVALPRIADRPP
jgi:S1-C subfamily serine protease